MKHKKDSQKSQHFHHGYEKQQHNVAGARLFLRTERFASGEADMTAIVIPIDAEQAR
jgi:hypothetical protein